MKRNWIEAIRGAASGAVVALLGLAMPAHAQVACGARDAVAAALEAQFGETVTATGVDRNGNLLEIFSSEDGTWTVVLTIPGGPACLLSSGDGWWRVEEHLPPAERRSS